MLCKEYPLLIPAGDYRLSGFVHKPPGFPPIVVFFHGFTGHKIENGRLYVELARALCEKGIGSLRFDFRGHGESPLPFEEFRLDYAFEDAERVIEYVRKKLSGDFDVSRLGILGLSMGGAVAINIAAKDQGIKAVALLSPAINFKETSVKMAIERQRDPEFFYWGPFRLKMKCLESFNIDLTKKAERISAPTLIIHAVDDETVPFKQSEFFFERLQCKKRFVKIDKGGHVFYTYESRTRVIKEVVEWFLTNVKTI